MHVNAQIPESQGIGVGLGNMPTNYLTGISKVYSQLGITDAGYNLSQELTRLMSEEFRLCPVGREEALKLLIRE